MGIPAPCRTAATSPRRSRPKPTRWCAGVTSSRTPAGGHGGGSCPLPLVQLPVSFNRHRRSPVRQAPVSHIGLASSRIPPAGSTHPAYEPSAHAETGLATGLDAAGRRGPGAWTSYAVTRALERSPADTRRRRRPAGGPCHTDRTSRRLRVRFAGRKFARPDSGYPCRVE
jgi:hypothetical protein